MAFEVLSCFAFGGFVCQIGQAWRKNGIFVSQLDFYGCFFVKDKPHPKEIVLTFTLCFSQFGRSPFLYICILRLLEGFNIAALVFSIQNYLPNVGCFHAGDSYGRLYCSRRILNNGSVGRCGICQMFYTNKIFKI